MDCTGFMGDDYHNNNNNGYGIFIDRYKEEYIHQENAYMTRKPIYFIHLIYLLTVFFSLFCVGGNPLFIM